METDAAAAFSRKVFGFWSGAKSSFSACKAIAWPVARRLLVASRASWTDRKLSNVSEPPFGGGHET